LLGGLRPQPARTGYYFLVYHSVSGQAPPEVDLDFPLFRRQMEALAASGRVIAYDQALTHLQAGKDPDIPHFVLTFDDGYSDFYSHVFPLLRELGLPAIVYVTTGFVEEGIPYPVLERKVADARPVTWAQLGEMAESGLVTIGAHTHTHPNLPQVAPEQQIMELAKPRELFAARLGLEVDHFNYPRSRWNEETEALVANYYRSAVIGDGRPATSSTFNPLRIPRISVRRSDGWFFFQAKMHGWLLGEELIYNRVRRLLPQMP
jgi:peptidoglycan/xylan/chitin deacetylase (PgdA/CDA1 family)